jgi:hypothetical protein
MSYLRKIGKNYVIQFRWDGKTHQRSCGTSRKRDAEYIQGQVDIDLWKGKFPAAFADETEREFKLTDLQKEFFAFLDNRIARYSPQTIFTYKYDFKTLMKIVGDIE